MIQRLRGIRPEFIAKLRTDAAVALGCNAETVAVRSAGLAYGSPLRENYRQAASIVSRVLAGTRPADIPVGEPKEFDFVINLTTVGETNYRVSFSLIDQAEAIGKLPRRISNTSMTIFCPRDSRSRHLRTPDVNTIAGRVRDARPALHWRRRYRACPARR